MLKNNNNKIIENGQTTEFVCACACKECCWPTNLTQCVLVKLEVVDRSTRNVDGVEIIQQS